MPKEIVVQSSEHLYEGENEQGLVEVSWQNDLGHVQIGTYTRNAQTFETMREAAWFVTLSRDGINELIRYLRRARDRSFGKDE